MTVKKGISASSFSDKEVQHRLFSHIFIKKFKEMFWRNGITLQSQEKVFLSQQFSGGSLLDNSLQYLSFRCSYKINNV